MSMIKLPVVLIVIVAIIRSNQFVVANANHNHQQQHTFSSSSSSSNTKTHNNYAIIVSTSRYWFNYRHHTNALLIYQYLKQYGNYTDDHIILMLADEYIVNPRNPIKNHIYNTATDSVIKNDKIQQHQQRRNQQQYQSLYTDDIEIDYRGEDVTVENFIYAMTGGSSRRTSDEFISQSLSESLYPVLNTNSDSHILVYMTGHGGDLFLKFQDIEEITSVQFAQMFQYMYQNNQYREIIFIADTCQAFTLGDKILEYNIPNISIIGSSLRSESSYAHVGQPILGVSVVEKYTHYMMEYITSKQQSQHTTTTSKPLSLLQVLYEPFNSSKHTNMLNAHVGINDTNSIRKLHTIPWDDYFVQNQYNNNNNNNQLNQKKSIKSQQIKMISENHWLSSLQNFQIKTTTTTTTTTTKTNFQFATNETPSSSTTTIPMYRYNEEWIRTHSDTTMVLEPNHPLFILLIVLLFGFVIIGSQYY